MAKEREPSEPGHENYEPPVVEDLDTDDPIATAPGAS